MFLNYNNAYTHSISGNIFFPFFFFPSKYIKNTLIFPLMMWPVQHWMSFNGKTFFFNTKKWFFKWKNNKKKRKHLSYIYLKKKKIFLIDTKNVKDEGKTFSIKISFQYHNIYDISTRRKKRKFFIFFSSLEGVNKFFFSASRNKIRCSYTV